MKRTKNILTTIFVTMMLLTLATVIIFETNLLPFGYYAATSEQAEFLLVTMMELTTLALIPLALRLFKFERVHRELVSRQAEGLAKWGVLRLLFLLVPMLVNTLLYYAYANTTFGYMAIIIAITLPFVYPSMNRCLSEVEQA